MSSSLRHLVLSGIALLVVAFATSGCEPEFEDDACEFDEDCFPDEICEDNRCVFETNECNGNEVLEHSVGDPCGPCNLDEYRCHPDDPDQIECFPGDTECPDLDIVTQGVTDIGDREATFNGEIQEFPHEEEIVELGFCYAEGADEPTTDDACAYLDEVPEVAGEFSLDVDGLRPGTEHFVRVHSVTGVGTDEYANDVDFTTTAPVPENVETESTADEVVVTWDEIDGATGYEVRIDEDDDQVHSIDDPEVTSFEDGAAPAGSLGAPQNAEATTNQAAGITITWDAPEGDSGEDVDYEVAAEYPDAKSDYSDTVDGTRSAPDIAGYDLYVADDDNGQWEFLGDTTSHLHEEAPKAPLDAGQISASDGTSAEHVTLAFDESPEVGEAPEQTYRLRTVYGDEADQFGGETGEFTGQRGITGSVEYQWYRSTDSDGNDFDPIDGATDSSFEDDDPDPGEIRHYYAEVNAVESDPTDTNTDTGYIATGGQIADLDVSDITAESAELSAQVVSVGDPAADDHGFCFATDDSPSLDDECIELGAPDESQPDMSASLDDGDIDPHTTYYVVGYIDSDTTGTVYTDEQPFTTAPQAPYDLTADDGTLTWSHDADADIDEYRIVRDGVEIGVSDNTEFTDEDDLTPGAPQQVSASDDDTSEIAVQWQAPDGEDAVEYYVTAVIDPGAEGATGDVKQSAASDSAFDDSPEVDHYEIRSRIEGGDWSDWTDVSETSYEFDDEDAAPTIEFGSVSATDDNPDGIVVDIDVLDEAPIEASAGPQVEFEVQSVTDAGESSSAQQTTGVRDADDLQDQIFAAWEFDDDGEWESLLTIDDIDDPNHLDSEPAHEESRTYRAAAQIQGTDDTLSFSPTVTGTRGEEENGD